MTRFEPTTSCLTDKYLTSSAMAFTRIHSYLHAAAGGCYNNGWCSVNFFAQKNKN
jgi:hypothetical protein